MSHIFISYSHKNMAELETVKQALVTNGIPETEYWYDTGIKVGDRWLERIDRALEEADGVIVIVTKESMESLYVTYEWSWALGNQTPVFPLIFKDGEDCMHDRLKAIQYQPDCSHGIPNGVIAVIQSKRVTPPEIHYLNKQLLTMLMRLRIATTVTLWAYEHIADNIFKIRHLTEGLITETRMLYLEQLPDFILKYRDALQFNQLYYVRRLATMLREDFYQAFMHPSESTYQEQNASYEEVVPKLREVWEEIIKSIEFFDIQHGWMEAYEKLKEYLQFVTVGKNLQLVGVPYIINPDIIIKWAYKNDDYGELLVNTIEDIRRMKLDT